MADRQFRGPRMAKHWGALTGSQTLLTADTTVVVASIEVEHPGETILRMIGEYVIGNTAAPTALDTAILTVGIAVVSTDSVAAAATSDPFAEPEYPWMYWASHALFFNAASIFPDLGTAVVRKVIDIRSMRKAKPRESLAMIVQYTGVVGTPDIAFTNGGIRVLTAT